MRLAEIGCTKNAEPNTGDTDSLHNQEEDNQTSQEINAFGTHSPQTDSTEQRCFAYFDMVNFVMIMNHSRTSL